MSLCEIETQTLDVLSLTPSTKLNIIEPVKPWGRLYSTYLYMKPVDLDKETFKLGRSESCDVTINDNMMKKQYAVNISKLHFTIEKSDDFTYIYDNSKNGTFLNGKKIGRNNKSILQNDDVISIGTKNLKVYVFKVFDNDENTYLPPELRRKYQVSRKLGSGAVGEVRLIFDKDSCQPYAVKKIDKSNTSAKHKLNHPDKIRSEINILQRLNHPGVIEMREVVETKESVFIVLEYLEGGELTDRILSLKALSEAEVKFIFYQIVLAVDYLHSNGVTHRDLKPENILLRDDNPRTIVKLTDFGLSKLINDENEFMRTMCGTPFYLAPEVLDRSIYYYTHQVDIWSMGVILYYMLSQEHPFNANTRENLNRDILEGKFTFEDNVWDTISTDAKDLIMQMLKVNAVQRISIEDIMKHPWIDKDTEMKDAVLEMIQNEMKTAIYTGDTSSYLVDDSDSENYHISPPRKRSRSGV